MTRWWTSRAAPWGGLAFAALALVATLALVDLSPEVEGEFFFAEDDPQMRASEAVEERFPMGPQLILRVADRSGDGAAYIERIDALTEDQLKMDGIALGSPVDILP